MLESDNELKNNMSRSEKKIDICNSSVSEQRKEDLNDASVSMTASSARKTGDKTFVMAEPVEPRDVRAGNDFMDSESAGAVSLHLVHDDAVLPTSVSFTYHVPMVVSSVEPAVGVLAGGTLVRVIGVSFDATVPLMVRVGSEALVRAHVLSSTLLEVLTPSQTQPGLLALELSQNGQDFTSDEVLFEY